MPTADDRRDDSTDLDLDAALDRSRARVVRRMPTDSPLVDGLDVLCPWCRRPLSVRFTSIARCGDDPISGEADGDRTPYIDGVGMKCAGRGCGFRPDFDVPLAKGVGYWPRLDAREEYERELKLRGGEANSRLDAAYDAVDDDGAADVEDRLEALGYLD